MGDGVLEPDFARHLPRHVSEDVLALQPSRFGIGLAERRVECGTEL